MNEDQEYADKIARWEDAVAHGAKTEQRFFTAFLDRTTVLPDWFYGVRVGTTIDDANGIDAFAITTRGEIPIQIKSSMAGMRKFTAKHRPISIVVVVIQKNLCHAAIVAKTIKYIEPMWLRRGKKRRGYAKTQ